MRSLMKWGIYGFQALIRPFLGGTACRFHPTCSQYATEAIDKHGSLKGSWMAMKRIGKCHPFHKGGYDPVPEQQR